MWQDFLVEEQRDARRNLAQFMADLPALRAEMVVRRDERTTVHEIHKAADDLSADLIVVSTQGKGPLTRLFLGSVTEKIFQSATVDVLALPPAQAV